jgi:hypothetical protein
LSKKFCAVAAVSLPPPKTGEEQSAFVLNQTAYKEMFKEVGEPYPTAARISRGFMICRSANWAVAEVEPLIVKESLEEQAAVSSTPPRIGKPRNCRKRFFLIVLLHVFDDGRFRKELFYQNILKNSFNESYAFFPW